MELIYKLALVGILFGLLVWIYPTLQMPFQKVATEMATQMGFNVTEVQKPVSDFSDQYWTYLKIFVPLMLIGVSAVYFMGKKKPEHLLAE